MSRRLSTGFVLSMLMLAGCASAPTERICHYDASEQFNSPGCLTAAIKQNHAYAVLAVLAYRKDNQILSVPSGFVETTDRCDAAACDGALGYQYAVFDRIENGTVSERVIAFRGSDDLRGDWWRTNALGSPAQNLAALRTYQRVAQSSGVPVTVVGDSLGGALATQVSICFPAAGRVALNTSPRASARLCQTPPVQITDAERMMRHRMFAEHGEALQLARPLFGGFTQVYNQVDCIAPRRFRWFSDRASQHNIGALAACMVARAAAAGDAAAIAYLDANRSAIQTLLVGTRYEVTQ